MIQLLNINKSFGQKTILSDMSLIINENEFVCITGESGAGKTTLLNIMGLLEKPDNGKIIINEKENFTKKDILRLRREFFGYIFQDYLLLSDITVKENICISNYKSKKNYINNINEVLQKTGLNTNYLDKKVWCLSGGEKQKVAIARMMLKQYKLVLADEPTGNLDYKNKMEIIELFKKIKKEGKTRVCGTHDKDVVSSADRVIHLTKI